MDAQLGPEQLDQLLIAWRACRDPVLARLIDGVSVELQRRDPSGAPSGTARVAWFQGVLDAPRVAALPALLEVIAAQQTPGEAARLLDELRARWPEDPRLASGLLDFLERPAWTRPPSLRLWRRVWAVLGEHRDRRTLTRLAAWQPERSFEGATAAFMHEHRDRLLAQWEDAWPVEVLSPAERREVDRLSARLAAEQSRRQAASRAVLPLLAAVYESPTDKAARAVYADAAAEAGEPHGEFTLLQLAGPSLDPAGAVRMSALLRRHWRSWLGPLAPLLHRGDLVFEDGFLARCGVRAWSPAAVQAALGDARWSTVRAITLRDSGISEAGALQLVLQRAARSLREIQGLLDLASVRAVLANPTGRPLEVLGFALGTEPRPLEVHTPELREVHIPGSSLGWVSGLIDGLGRPLERLVMTVPLAAARDWGAALHAVPPEHVARLLEQPRGWAAAEVRVVGAFGGHRPLHLVALAEGIHVRIGAAAPEALTAVAAVLDALPAERITGVQVDGASAAWLARSLARLPAGIVHLAP